ncbi:MAG: cytochrome c3 family protein [Pirellulaceae bacterium]
MDETKKLPRDSAKQRALRIPLAYHRASGSLRAWKLALTLACCLTGGVYFAWVLAGGRPAATQVSPGILAKDHARWDSDCKACHVPFVPQRPDAGGTRTLSLSLTASSSKEAHQKADAKCSECHKSAGIHNNTQIAAEVESCASCHRDHQGRDFVMARMDDSHCIRCHALIADHRTAPDSANEAPIVSVTSFELPSADAGSGHPPFRSLQTKEDPGNIRFSHHLHMTPGQLYPGQAAPAGKPLTQLVCDSCHQPETTTETGAYMRPIKYEQHCRACHPLNLPGQPEVVVPHGLTSTRLEDVVLGYLAEGAKDSPKISPPKRLIPGKTPGSNLSSTMKLPPELVATHRLTELRQNKCSQCHSWQEQNSKEVQPSRIPNKWLRHARFNHQKHQTAAKCQDCHAQAVAKLPPDGVPGKLADDEEVMIPNIDNCARCHAPRNESAATGGARFDCAECHRYHHAPPNEKPLRSEGLSSIHNFEEFPSTASFLVSHVADVPSAQPTRKDNHFVGTQSCSATGCHGAAKGNDLTTAYSRFTANDPHTRAFLLLYTEPSLDIFRRLTNQPQAKLEDAAYFDFLQQKCVGCHATPPPDSGKANRAESFAAGISCESCHEPAASWEYTHFNRKAKKSSDMRNLTDLSTRATACAECHIGPQITSGKTYDVNHDLIAAGHPRLTFEFESQLANLPSHWSAAKDVKSHFETWRIGELATAAQQDKLHAARPAYEFASHRCFDCHHGLTPKPALGRIAFPPFSGLSQQERTRLTNLPNNQKAHTAIVLEMSNLASGHTATGSAGTLWEENVKLLMALTAYIADDPRKVALAKETEELGVILSQSFLTLPRDKLMKNQPFFTGGPYDSPTGFDPNDKELKQLLQQIRGSLATP